MENLPVYRLSTEAWEMVQKAMPRFWLFFAVANSGTSTNAPVYKEAEAAVLATLDIDPDLKDSIEAHLKICIAAQYARGFFRAVRQPDDSRLLYRIS